MDTKKLRQKILDLAIHGKLVPQDPNDEPASVLLERIRAEKERLIKEGKIKKSKASKTSDTPHYENMPFEIPSSWEFVNFGSICKKLTDGSHNPPPKRIKGYAVISAQNIKNGKIVFTNKDRYTDEKGFQKENPRTRISRGDIILGIIGGSIGNVGIYEHDELVIAQRSISIIDTYISNIYCFYLLQTQIFQSLFIEKSNGNAQAGVYLGELDKMIIPLPPLKEQHRIVAEIERWFVLIDQIEQGKVDLQTTIKQTKSKILDLAIHGKLVPQNPNDEPASELFKRINPKAEITCDNGQYGKVPEGWIMINISQISELLSGRDLTNNDCNGNEEGVPYLIGASNIVDNQLNITRWTNNPQVISSKGDILISCKGTIGEVVLNNIGNMHIARQFMAIRPNKKCIVTEYFLYYLLAMVRNIKNNARGVIPGISREDILTKCLFLPPLAEQHRIVNTIQKTFAKLDAIMESL